MAEATGDIPLIVAHRGASADAPENTLSAFKLAWEQGADAIEGDFHQTRDGEVVCIHDPDTERVAGVKKIVTETTLEELRKLDVGVWRGERWQGTVIPTLAEVLALVPEGKRIYVEIKGKPVMVAPVLEQVRKSGLGTGQVILIAFNAEVILTCKELAPEYRAYWLVGFKKEDSGVISPDLETILKTLKGCGADGLSTGLEHVQEAVIQGVQGAGYEYHVWTVDEEETARKFIQLGAKSITTNRPGEIRGKLSH